jgi:hypothetical protein
LLPSACEPGELFDLRIKHQVKPHDFQVSPDPPATSPSGVEVQECRRKDSSRRLWLKEWNWIGSLSREQFHREIAIYSCIWHLTIIRFDEGSRLTVGNAMLAERIRAAHEEAQRFSDGTARVKRDFNVFLRKFWPRVTQQ